MKTSKIIYDIGSNNGDDIPYYLKKSDRVVAIEANPVLCNIIQNRFAAEIENGRLIVENYVLTSDDKPSGNVFFYLHRDNHVLSQFPEPKNPEQFDRVILPFISVKELFSRHGDPYYVKIDVENYDAEILKSLLSAGIHPSYISAEAHSLEPFCILLQSGHYHAFKFVNGATVDRDFHHHTINGNSGPEPYSFRQQSAGPFGEDIPGAWMNEKDFLMAIALKGTGWWDIHAKLNEKPDSKKSRHKLIYLIISIFIKEIKLRISKYIKPHLKSS